MSFKLNFSYIHAANPMYNWVSPFINEEFDFKKCKNVSSAHLNWAYKSSFIRPKEEIRDRLQAAFRDSFIEHSNRLWKVAKNYPL
jgi:hypothetical protein